MQKCTSTLQNYQQVISLWKKPMPPKFELFFVLDLQYLLPQKIPTFFPQTTKRDQHANWFCNIPTQNFRKSKPRKMCKISCSNQKGKSKYFFFNQVTQLFNLFVKVNLLDKYLKKPTGMR